MRHQAQETGKTPAGHVVGVSENDESQHWRFALKLKLSGTKPMNTWLKSSFMRDNVLQSARISRSAMDGSRSPLASAVRMLITSCASFSMPISSALAVQRCCIRASTS